MDVIYALIPMMLIFGFLVVVVFIWMAKSGQFDDMDGAANRIFMDDEYPEDTKDRADSTSDSKQDAKASTKVQSHETQDTK